MLGLQKYILFPYTTLFRSLKSKFNWSLSHLVALLRQQLFVYRDLYKWLDDPFQAPRSEEHTSELQSLRHLVCRLLLEKKIMLTSCVSSRSYLICESMTLII